ncbi:MAG: acetyl-CoA hydrolase/transferase C-terminal domain-containing protein [Syntrophobacteraceae bacterium]|jgi:itaconate CoA-transferase
MSSLRSLYEKKLTSAEEAVSEIESGSALSFGMAAGQPPALLGAIASRVRSGNLGDLRVYYQNAMTHAAETILADDVLHGVHPCPLFMTEVDRRITDKQRHCGRKILSYVPSYFYQVPRLLTEFIPIDTFVITVSPLGDAGYFSLGTNNDYASAVIRSCRRSMVEVNRNMPRVFGESLVHVSEVDKIVENDVPLLEAAAHPAMPEDDVIGKTVSELIPDGATIQLGIGGIPNAVCRYLTDHKDLGIHTEMLTPGMADLIECGAANGRRKTLHRWKHVFTFALGDRHLYDLMHDNPTMESYPSSHVNHPCVIAQNANMASVNSALEIDLYGQVNAESMQWHEFSGTGGALDFMRGSFDSPGGKSILAIYSTAQHGAVSRIVPRLTSIVTDPRMDTEFVVTEHGIANLKGKSTRERALSLINIAHPKFRDQLAEEARKAVLI